MRTLHLKNINQFMVISDVHLRNPDDELTHCFIDVLQKIIRDKKESDGQLDALFLLGDIFDFITVAKSFFFEYWKTVFSTFKLLKENAIALYFIEGNHDFGFEHFPSKQLDEYFTAYGDFKIELEHKNAGRILLAHGDNIICPSSYLKFRAFVKSKSFQQVTGALFPGFFLHFIFSRYAKLSRSQDKYRSLSHSFLETCLLKFLENDFKENEKELNALILGHVHVFVDEFFQKTRVLIGPGWMSYPTYLTCNTQGEFHRVDIK